MTLLFLLLGITLYIVGNSLYKDVKTEYEITGLINAKKLILSLILTGLGFASVFLPLMFIRS